jgi:hypothetical protein
LDHVRCNNERSRRRQGRECVRVQAKLEEQQQWEGTRYRPEAGSFSARRGPE